jgi:hypothetical protein
LAGLIDGDGNFYSFGSDGMVNISITMDIRDKNALLEIKKRFGGNIYTVKDANASRYMLSNKKGLMAIIQRVNGLIRKPSRLEQMNKLCIRYGIELKKPVPLTFNNG